MLPPETLDQAASLLETYRARGWRLATAESCTGGLIAAALTAIPGSSDVVDRGFVTYSNESKTDMLGVPAELIATHGAVSAEVAAHMAEGALRHSLAHVTVAVTGVAGPGGGTPDKPVGLVWFARATRGAPTTTTPQTLPGTRTQIRAATVATALRLLREAVLIG